MTYIDVTNSDCGAQHYFTESQKHDPVKRLLNMKTTQQQYNILVLRRLHYNSNKNKNMKKNKHKSNPKANHNFKSKILFCGPTSLNTFSCF